MHKLDILITQYNETDDIIKPLLDSVAKQYPASVLDHVHVIIMNDGSDTLLSDTLLSSYKFNLSYIKETHSGISGTRNKLLDVSDGDYIMYCDADDMFYRHDALKMIFENIERYDFDYMKSAFFEEKINPETGLVDTYFHPNSVVFIHGKVYKRSMLIDKQIRWKEHLKDHEDRYFNVLVNALCDKPIIENRPFYLWKFRSNSIVRSQKNFFFSTFSQFLQTESALLHQYLKRGFNDFIVLELCHALIRTYYTTHSYNWIYDSDDIKKSAVDKQIKYLYRKFKKFFDNRPLDLEKNLLLNIKTELSNTLVLDDNAETFYEWLESLDY